MEIKDYYIVLKRNVMLVILITAIFAVIAYLLSISAKPTFQSSVSLQIDRIPTQNQAEVDYYQYDNFYSSAVSGKIAGNLVDWLTSASTVTQVFQKAGYPKPSSDIKGLTKVFNVAKKQEGSSIISIAYSSNDQTQAQKIIASARDILTDKVANYNESDKSGKLITQADPPVVVEVPKQITLNVLIAAFLGLVISLGIVSLKEALR